jgi:Tol biopolymer transport system component
VDGAGAQANGASAEPSLSADGRYVAFRSAASNLVGSDTNAADDIFVRDRTAGTTTRVSVGAAGLQANGASGAPAVSGNGGFVAFHSSASNLVGGDTNSATDVFVRSLAGATTTRVSLSAGGGQGSDPSSSPSISSDGTRIAFQSTAALASGDDNGVSDVYVRDRSANTTTWAAAWAQAQGWTSRGANSSPSISGDGRYVALALDSDVAISDLNNARDIYEYDLTSGEWAHISQDTVTGPGNTASDSPSLSSDGTRAAFESLATNFHADTNGAQDTFVHQWVKSPATGGTASGTSPAEGPAQEETQPPRHCGLAKPEAPTGEPAPDSSSGSAGTQAVPTDGAIRVSCTVTPVPPPVSPPIPPWLWIVPPTVGGGAIACAYLCVPSGEEEYPEEPGGGGGVDDVEVEAVCKSDKVEVDLRIPGMPLVVVPTTVPCTPDSDISVKKTCFGGQVVVIVTVGNVDQLIRTGHPCLRP